MTPPIILTCEAVVTAFQSGRPAPDYGYLGLRNCPGKVPDLRGLLYGRHRTACHQNGDLHTIIRTYLDTAAPAGSELSDARAKLRAILPLVEKSDYAYMDRSIRVWGDEALVAALSLTGRNDPAMRKAQDNTFRARYWTKTEATVKAAGFTLPLALLVVLDSHVHGAWGPIMVRTNRELEGKPDLNEHKWIQEYLRQRNAWLLCNHRESAFRTRTLMGLAGLLPKSTGPNWNLGLPITIRADEPFDVTEGEL